MLAPMSDADRRAHERVTIAGDLRGEVLVYQPLTLTEISLSGALVETTFPLSVDSSHDLRLSLGSTPVMATAQVVHSRITQIEGGRLTYQSAIEFIEPSDAVIDAINGLLAELRGTKWD
jgi:hypothetical protein